MKILFYLSKLKKFRVLDYLILLEALFWLVFSKFILVFYSIKKIAPYLGKLNKENSFQITDNQIEKATKINTALFRAALFIPWKSVCIDKAIAGMIMLNYRKISTVLCLGVLHKKNTNELKAHAWILVADKIVIGGQRSRNFKVVAKFVKNHD